MNWEHWLAENEYPSHTFDDHKNYGGEGSKLRPAPWLRFGLNEFKRDTQTASIKKTFIDCPLKKKKCACECLSLG